MALSEFKVVIKFETLIKGSRAMYKILGTRMHRYNAKKQEETAEQQKYKDH